MTVISVLLSVPKASKIPSLGFQGLRAILAQALPDTSVIPIYLDSDPPAECDVLIANVYSAWGLTDIARTFRRWNWTTPDRRCPVILGGPGLYNPLPAVDLADYICNSEDALVALIGQLVHREPLEWKKPAVLAASNHYITIVMPTEGCRYRCSFCQLTTVYGYALRHSSLESVSEIIRAHHPRRIQIHAASILQHPDFLDLAQELRQSKAKVYLGSMNLNEINDRNARALFGLRPSHTVASEADLDNDTEVYFGLESASDRVLRRMRKPLTTAVARDRVATLQKAGFRRLGFYLILGHPYCNEEDLRRTGEFLNGVKTLLGPEGSVRVKCTPFLPHIGTADALEHAPRYADCLRELDSLKASASPNVRFDISSPGYYLANVVLMRGGIQHTALVRHLAVRSRDVEADAEMDQILSKLSLPPLRAHLTSYAPMDISASREWVETDQLCALHLEKEHPAPRQAHSTRGRLH